MNRGPRDSWSADANCASCAEAPIKHSVKASARVGIRISGSSPPGLEQSRFHWSSMRGKN